MELKNSGKSAGEEYLDWFVKHEGSCLLNHEGSPLVKNVILSWLSSKNMKP